ncbi:MAG TPA: FecR family protein [Pyrinomonadaceae bacterium]|nr:FecR family protein [Pyrinomonadaceae bacterium]
MIYKDLILKRFTVLTLLFFLAAAAAQAQTSLSINVLSVEGAVRITRASNGGAPTQIKPRAGNTVMFGDVIRTSAGGRLVIRLSDGSQAIVSENTTVEIKDFNNSPRTIFNLIRGKTRIKIERLGGKPNPYRITTPTAVIAVRGTIFDVFVKDDETRVFVVEGEVGVTNLLLPDREVILTPGQFTRVRKETPPSPPALFKPGRNNEDFKSLAEQRRGRGIFDDPSADNPGKSGNFPGNSASAPGKSSPTAPGNSANKGRRGGN